MKFKFLISIAAFLIYNFSVGQAIFTNSITAANPSAANPFTAGQTVDPNLSVSGIGRGTGITANAGSNRYNASSWNTASLDPDAYFEFTLTPNSGYNINLLNFVYISQRSNTSIAGFAFRSSIDGFVSDIGVPDFDGTTIDLTAAAYQNLSSAITFRFYAWGAGHTGNTFSIDDFTFNGTVLSSELVDWANLQFPATATIDIGNSATIYARVWEPGVTLNAGADPSITAEIGYSTTNTDPELGGFTWVNAPFNVQVPLSENDEYVASIGAALAPGTYYYASRFKISGGAWSYGGYNAGGGGFWDGTTNVNGVLTINDTKVDWGNLQSPESGSIVVGGTFNVYAQVYEAGVTEGAGAQGANIQTWIGYSTANTDPSTAGWTWLPANFNSPGGGANNDEYMLEIGSALPAGTYYYASRFRHLAGTYSYGGILASGVSGDFWDGTTYISGVLTVSAVPAAEMDLRGGAALNQPIVSGSVTTSSLNSTLFAGTNIGSSQVKTYRIKSIGTANLNVSSISWSGANPSDFSVSAATPQIIAYPSGTYDFTISFSPLAQGNRSAIVSIANNDSNENPYTFMIQGTGDCITSTNTITPLSGPVGTEVMITATANNLNSATVTFNGIAAAVTQVDATHIKVIVPAGATSGALVTTNVQGCSASNPFTVVNNVISACEGTGSARTQLFISEVTDHGSGSHSYVEIYNATGTTVNLNNYKVNLHNNGAVAVSQSITLPSYDLPNNTAYVVAFGQSDSSIAYGGVTADFISTVNGINDNDNIRLLNSSGTWIDLWGRTTGAVFTVSSNDYYYRRKNVGITAPSTTWNAADWISGTPVDYTDVGLYDFSTGTPPTVTVHPGFSPSCKSTVLTVAGAEGHVGDNPLAYQWYYVAPNAPTWEEVPDAGVFSGATTTTLTISDLAGLEGYQFYSQVRENGVSCYAASNAVMVHEAQTVTWNGSWSPSAPTIASKVIIAATYNTVTHGDFEACSVTINPVQSLTIGSGDYVLIQTDLAVNGNLVIDNSGSLVMIDDSGTVSSAGNTQILRTTDPYKKYDYTYWSSPVLSANIGTTFPDWRTDHSYSFNTENFSDLDPLDGFDDDQNDWTLAGPSATMSAGKGYIVMAPTSGTFPTTNTVVFSGTANNGVVNVPLALSGVVANPNDDFNLIGNPYPSAISATDFINANADISGTLYFWSHVTAVNTSNPGPDYSNYTRDDYALFNLTGGTRASLTTPESSVPTGYIASGQGFFVEAQAATSVLFNNSMRSKLYDNSDFFRTTANATVEAEQPDRIWLNLQHADDLFSQQLIGYFNESTLDFDWGYDGVVSKTGNALSFYSFIDGDHYRIQGRHAFSQNDVVPLGYGTTVAGTLSISIDAAEGQLADGQDVFIEDMQNGIIHNLKQSAYTFLSGAGTFNDRFLLRYLNGSLSTDDLELSARFAVTVNSGNIGIRSGSAVITGVALYDMLGRQVYEAKNLAVNTHYIDNMLFSKQSLIVKTTLATGEIITRKIVLY